MWHKCQPNSIILPYEHKQTKAKDCDTSDIIQTKKAKRKGSVLSCVIFTKLQILGYFMTDSIVFLL